MNQITLLQSFLAFLVMQNLDASIERLSIQTIIDDDNLELTGENRSMIELTGKLISPRLQEQDSRKSIFQSFDLFINSMEKQNSDIQDTDYSLLSNDTVNYEFIITFNLKY